MQLILRFEDGCTGDDGEQVTVTAPRFVWAGFATWIMAAGVGLRGTGRREAQEVIASGTWAICEGGMSHVEMSRAAAQWVMVYFEIVAEARIVIRPDEHDMKPIDRLVIDGRKMV